MGVESEGTGFRIDPRLDPHPAEGTAVRTSGFWWDQENGLRLNVRHRDFARLHATYPHLSPFDPTPDAGPVPTPPGATKPHRPPNPERVPPAPGRRRGRPRGSTNRR